MAKQPKGRWMILSVMLSAALAACDQTAITGTDRLEVNAPSEWRGNGFKPLLPGDPIEVEPQDYGIAWPD